MSEPLSSVLEQRLKPLVDGRARDERFSGTVLVSRDGEVLFAGAWGQACRAWAVPNTLDTLFTTASVTKVFTATAILQLVEEGHLKLDEPVRTVMPLERSTIADDVTVKHLLTHTSGIGDYYPEDEEQWPAVFRTFPTYNLNGVADFLPLFVGLPARFPAGTRYEYCNAGYVLLGRIIEIVTGQEYFDVIAQRVFTPAGMQRSCFPTVDSVVAQLAEPYDVSTDAAGARHWTRCVTTAIPPAPDGGLASSATELDRFWHALLGGQLLGSDLLEQMLTPQVTIDEDFAYGLGVYLISAPPHMPRYEAHGFDHGISAFIAHYPTAGINSIVLSNLDGAATTVYRQLDALLAEHSRPIPERGRGRL